MLGIFLCNSGTCFILQWHCVLLSAGAFGGVRPSMAWCFAVGRYFCCWCGPQVGVGGREVTLGIFPCNSGTCSSFSGMAFCCRQVLLVVRRLTSSSSRRPAAFGACVQLPFVHK